MKSFRLITIILFFAAVCARNANTQNETSEPPEDVLKEAAKKLVPGWEQHGDIYCNPLAMKNTDEITVELEGSRCYAFVALARKGISDLSLSVFEKEKEVASDKITGNHPIAKWCSAAPVSVSVKLSAYSGSGEYVFGVFAEPRSPKVRADKVGGQSNDLIANRIRQLHSRFGEGRAAISSVFKGNLKKGKSTSFKIRLIKGHCYTVIGAGELSVRNLDLNLLDSKGKVMCKDSTSSCFASMNTDPCIKQTGQYEIKVTMSEGSGQFGVQVFSD